MSIKETIQNIKSLRQQKEAIAVMEKDNMRPVATDVDMIPEYYRRFLQVANASNKDNLKAFIFIIFFLYSPVSCVGRCPRMGIRRRIARLLHISNETVSQQLGDAKVLFNRHRGFQNEVERIYKSMMSA